MMQTENNKVMIIGSGLEGGLVARICQILDEQKYGIELASVENMHQTESGKKPIEFNIKPHEELIYSAPLIENNEPWYAHFDKFKKRKK